MNDTAALQNFWVWVHQCAAHTADPVHSYEALSEQFRGIQPSASDVEYKAAQERIAQILGVKV